MKEKKEERLDKNYAENKEFAAEILGSMLEIHNSLIAQRQGREQVWQRSYRLWSVDTGDAYVNANGTSSVDQSYTGMANLKIPQLRKEVETMTRRLFKGLLPEDYLKGEPATGFVDPELTAVNTQVVRHYYDNVMQIKKALQPWIKQMVLFGTSPVRQFWHKRTNEMFYKKRVPYADERGVIRFKAEAVREEVTMYNAPKLRTEDMFSTWVYPHNALTQEDIEMVFYRTYVKRRDLEEKAEAGMCAGLKDFIEDGNAIKDDWPESQERLAQFGDSGEFRSIQGNDYFEMLEVWCDLVLPGSDDPVPCVVEIVNNGFCTRIQRNPYWHQMLPFDFGRFIIPPPGEFYGRGLPEASMSLQLQLDDTMNQTMDATTLALNNVTIINPAYAPNAESFEVEPGAVWWADPNAVKQFTFPDLSESGYKAAGILRSWIGELSDNQPQLPDPIAGKARSTGQAQLAVNEWQTDLFNFIDILSVEALNSMAFKTHSLLQQNLTEDDIIRVAGKYAGTWIDRVVTPEDLVGRYKFKWMGALQIENQAIKTQQMMNFLQIYRTLPPDAQSQVRIRWENLIIKIMRDGFLIKDIDNIIESEHMRTSVDPYLEEKILTMGGDISVQKEDDDTVHINVHSREQGLDKSPITRAKRSKHIMEHQDQLTKKALEAKQVQMQMQMVQAQAQMGGAQKGAQPGQLPPQMMGGQMPQATRGNTAQIPESTSQANLERGIKIGT